LAYDGQALWVGDDSLGVICELGVDGEVLRSVETECRNVKGMTFQGGSLWVVSDAAVKDTLIYSAWDSTYGSYPFYCVYRIDVRDGSKLDSLRFISPYPNRQEDFLWGIAWYNGRLYVSYNGGYGPCTLEIDPQTEEITADLCCAHPCGLASINGTLWCVRMTRLDGAGDLLMPLDIRDGWAHELRDLGYELGFCATDMAFDGENMWLCDRDARKIKKMARIVTMIASQSRVVEPVSYEIEQNRPNPFNPETRISFSLPRPAETSLRVYDVQGQLIRTIVEQRSLAAGRHAFRWDGRDGQGRDAASGTYVCRLEAEPLGTRTRSMLLMR
jgi:hypothetical protein